MKLVAAEFFSAQRLLPLPRGCTLTIKRKPNLYALWPRALPSRLSSSGFEDTSVFAFGLLTAYKTSSSSRSEFTLRSVCIPPATRPDFLYRDFPLVIEAFTSAWPGVLLSSRTAPGIGPQASIFSRTALLTSLFDSPINLAEQLPGFERIEGRNRARRRPAPAGSSLWIVFPAFTESSRFLL